jgi:hypothetical protein
MTYAGLLCLLMGVAVAEEKPCYRTKFNTEMFKLACANGGQPAAKRAGKAFYLQVRNKYKGYLTCLTCHQSLRPHYPLKAEALDLYWALGGR